ncbi:hypothetical protein [Streptomyces scabiei]|uniref:hypothetical protein n=1 Tax=Streptomyces scabiei TaxID=1930 RepID=UPI001B33781D|nr:MULTISPECIES: hypothetical protein [Streptomyces]MBP5891408.1 hypothetical protein [Streptomyces sp. LBUM 1481]MBP5921561.1 hypothetical protein [Streptomyces sp. LBUM 1483]MDX2690160.1 hypothetical protein [Streptomyces scabiei]MDX2809225.1 hypothetical protein [Streptomyces scabiei]MDX3124712.1 hypothetical protein [Streptomyces scabiei]
MTDSDEGPGGEDTDHRGLLHADREGHEMPSRRADPTGARRTGEAGEGGGGEPPADGCRGVSDAVGDGDPASGTAGPGSPGTGPTPFVDSLLAAAVRGGAGPGSAGEARAVAAFRAMWERGARTARTRRRDDWRPNARRRLQRSIRTTLAALLATLALGGVAVAAIGSAARDDEGAGREPMVDHGGDRRPRSTDNAPARPGPATADHPDRDRGPTASRQRDGVDPSHTGGKGNDKGKGNGNGTSEGDARRPSSRPGAAGVPDAPGPPDGVRKPPGAERGPAGTGRKPRGEVRAPETK